MNTYLLTWNPKKYPVEDFVANEIRPKTASFSMACHWTKAMRGDRVLLMRVGRDAPGLVAIGYVLGRFVDCGSQAEFRYQIPIKWSVIKTHPLISRDILWKKFLWPGGDPMRWTPQSGGQIVPDKIAQKVWEEVERIFTKSFSETAINGIHRMEKKTLALRHEFDEGQRKRGSVTRRERDPRARWICLEEKGYSCACCEMDFKAFYGDADLLPLVQVHHLKPVGKREKSEKTKLNDLSPVCPNCHAVIHSEDPPLTPNQVKKMLRKAVK